MSATVTLNDVIPQLRDVYYNEEWWHTSRLPPDEIDEYHRKLIGSGNIIVYCEAGKLLGYVEFYRISYEQWGRIVCHEPFDARKESINDGPICYVANTWIHKEWRNSLVYKVLKAAFFRANYTCKYFVGEALRKKTQPIKVLTKKDVYERYVKGV